eukprot:TRINITY_DN4551_c0_g2_i1.p1 TRINITY_DN4551_c0_g2~~TRINITY_DN4551_c0_g2_i1.p1  ORF type:complete len:140 (+),score=11.90 TRINITY_DN4551_c0_g2_i1:252-671(+)
MRSRASIGGQRLKCCRQVAIALVYELQSQWEPTAMGVTGGRAAEYRGQKSLAARSAAAARSPGAAAASRTLHADYSSDRIICALDHHMMCQWAPCRCVEVKRRKPRSAECRCSVLAMQRHASQLQYPTMTTWRNNGSTH